MKLVDLKDKHKGYDIYVLGSGGSLGFIDKAFFDNKIVVCTNFTIDFVNEGSNRYLVAKEPTEEMQKSAIKKKALIVTCEKHSGNAKSPLNTILYPDKTVIFNPSANVLKDKDQTTSLERSSSTIVSSIHLAAFMGAKCIILVGHDCGYLDKRIHLKNYNDSKAVTPPNAYPRWMKNSNVEAKTLSAKNILKQFYNIDVYSLNPFINFGLEGHNYKRF